MRGLNTGGGGTDTAGITVREGQRGRPAGTTVVGSKASARGREENLESGGRVCVTLTEAYGWDGAD